MTAAATDFLNELRQATDAWHKSVEQLPISSLLLSRQVNLDNYADYLIVLYGFVKEFEITVYPRVIQVIDDLDSRKKTELLVYDLLSLGINPAEIKTNVEPTYIQDLNLASALGSMYVMEGSTLGGQLISRHLENILGDSVKGSLTYLKAYNSNTGSLWKKFLQTFCELTVTNNYQASAIKGATETFRDLHQWMSAQSNT